MLNLKKAAFERGAEGAYTQQEVYTLLLCFNVLPEGTVVVGCGGVMYRKAGSYWLELDSED